MAHKVSCGDHAARIEILEPRRLLSSTASLEGTYSGIETYTQDGRQIQVAQKFTIGPEIQKSSTTALQIPGGDVALYLNIVFNPEAVLNFAGNVKVTKTPPHASALDSQSSGTSMLASTEYVGSLPSAFGPDGVIQTDGNTLTVSGELTTGIFPVDAFSFQGSKIAASKSSASALSKSQRPPITTLGTIQTLKANPILGKFKGHMTRQSDSTEFTTSAVIADNRKGKPAISFSLVEPGVGTIEIQSEIHPTHTGSFMLDLGSSSIDGIFGGHITHTGRLVLDLTLPGISILLGSQKRHG
jgi:hypothetical protein